MPGVSRVVSDFGGNSSLAGETGRAADQGELGADDAEMILFAPCDMPRLEIKKRQAAKRCAYNQHRPASRRLNSVFLIDDAVI